MKKDLLVTILFGKFNNGRQLYRIEEELEFIGNTQRVVIEPGFVTDLASVPFCLSATGRWANAAIVHDFLYKTHLTTRKDADRIFYKLMKDYGVIFIKRHLAYLAVRAFGGRPYKKHKNYAYRKLGYVESIKR